MFDRSDPWSSIRWLPVKNASGVEMPPFALLRATGVGTDGTITVAKPDADGKCDLTNGPTTVADGAFGQATADSPCVVLYATAGGTPAPGASWGPAAGSWYLTVGKTGFLPFGGATPQDSPAGTGLVLASKLQGGGPDCQGYIDLITDLCLYLDNTTNSTVSANFTALDLNARNVAADASGGTVVVAVPPASQVLAQEIRVEKTDPSANLVVIVRGDMTPFTGSQGGTLRDGEVGVVLRDQFDAVTLYKESSGPGTGQAMGPGLAGLTYAGPPAKWRLKDSVGGAAGPAQPRPGMAVGPGMMGLTY